MRSRIEMVLSTPITGASSSDTGRTTRSDDAPKLLLAVGRLSEEKRFERGAVVYRNVTFPWWLEGVAA